MFCYVESISEAADLNAIFEPLRSNQHRLKRDSCSWIGHLREELNKEIDTFIGRLIHGELYAEIENHKTSLQEEFSQHIVSLIRKHQKITLNEQFIILNNLLKEKLNGETYGATRKYLDEELGKQIDTLKISLNYQLVEQTKTFV
jgi:hypothetical protein